MSKFITGLMLGLTSGISLVIYYSSEKKHDDAGKKLQKLIEEYKILSSIEKARSRLPVND